MSNATRSIICPARSSFHLLRSSAGLGGAKWWMPAGYGASRCASTKSGGDGKKSLARMAEVQRLLYQAVERYKSGGGVEPIPKITLDHVTISYGNIGQGGPPNANKISSKVEMRFNVKNANWLNERVRDRILQMEKNRINKDGEIVITSAKSRAQKSNTEDAVAKLQVFSYQKKKLQAIIDSASYVPTPPSEATLKKIAMLSALGKQKQLEKKKAERQK
ncbi:uncharacterized protein LOC127240368 [Andrographis paniculata]|uniref:uncharacterized protein LOC127240368 n=1 Tax=Andrographis paniculata TaxID=175694 RepID=UPI0021E6F801|nr:uncharacterized protein LOC127240368 [Andrographis paniculata]